MRNNVVVIVVAALIVSYLLISSFAGDRAVGQQKVVPASATGRYQMAVGQTWSGQKSQWDVTYVLDTQTGQVWRRVWNDNGPWGDFGNPTKEKKQ